MFWKLEFSWSVSILNLAEYINFEAKNIIHVFFIIYIATFCRIFGLKLLSHACLLTCVHTFLCSCAFIYRLSLKVFFTWHCFKTLSAVYFIFFPYFVVQYIFKHFSTQILYIRTITNFMQAKYHFCLQPWLFEEKKINFNWSCM